VTELFDIDMIIMVDCCATGWCFLH